MNKTRKGMLEILADMDPEKSGSFIPELKTDFSACKEPKTFNVLMPSSLHNGDIRNLREVREFCVKYDVVLVSARWTNERGFREPIYFFSDSLGGYTTEAIKNSV